MTKIRFELAPKPTKAEKAAQGKTGFVVVTTRWVIERSNAWMERCKSLVKNFERTLSHATAKLNLCFIRLMLKRLANEYISNGFYRAAGLVHGVRRFKHGWGKHWLNLIKDLLPARHKAQRCQLCA